MHYHQPIRILQAFVANDKGGLTGYICQNYRFIDKNKVQFDFLTFEDRKLDFEDEFISMGARFYHISRPSHPISYAKSLKGILNQTEYAAVHFNMSYANFIPIIIARWIGAKRIIMHSHSTAIDDRRDIIRFAKMIIHKLGRHLMNYMADEYLACSSLAARWMYPVSILQSKRYHMAKNAIDVSKYNYNPHVRADIRRKLKISDDTFVIGHVGRFTYQKNHEFLIDIFKQVHDKLNNSLLLLIGEGPEENQMKEKVASLELASRVLFLGRRNDVPKLFQAMDCFVLPSRFEGLGIVGIEAQSSGLQCIFSDVVPREVDVVGKSIFLSLEHSGQWVSEILKISSLNNRKNTEAQVDAAGYNIHSEIKKIESLYEVDL
ncbi:group 1 glycosyl transferase [Megasphaera sp. BL7]|jgi:glycosyltransferase involved in cell wall biosynthesis|uniref:glycosyltransferase family 1 protein n=1 Tax=unclassified Megasphaera TaxID=2626256 RepID=UPI0003582940|nr:MULTISPECIES: glycosyltransferase family 1 protein [unclassified Megasphaera]EPP15619.1 group 1 glycosyl transferase [Megasphaera sp. BL7]EPP17963.1 group 1 glycosyl transferase [Megasphaera sp. NM10]